MKYCNQWNVKCNLNKIKIMIFKEEGAGGSGKLKDSILVHVLSKTGGSKRIYLFRGKARTFRRMGKTNRKYESALHTDICNSN